MRPYKSSKASSLIIMVSVSVLLSTEAFCDTQSEYEAAEKYAKTLNAGSGFQESVTNVNDILPDDESTSTLESYANNPDQMSIKGIIDMEDPDSASHAAQSDLSSEQKSDIETLKGGVESKEAVGPDDTKAGSYQLSQDDKKENEAKNYLSKDAQDSLTDAKDAITLAKSIQSNPEAQVDKAATFCADGSCESITQEENSDFGEVATRLSGVSESAQSFEDVATQKHPEKVRIFTGHAKGCKKYDADIIDCCDDDGWAKGILASCSDEEKELAKAKYDGLAVLVASKGIKSLKTAYVRVGTKEKYCVFPSKIAYDIQVYGRKDQLGRNFGSYKHPNCKGLTADDITSLNFDLIDFSNVVSETEDKQAIPEAQEAATRLQEQLTLLRESGSDD